MAVPTARLLVMLRSALHSSYMKYSCTQQHRSFAVLLRLRIVDYRIAVCFSFHFEKEKGYHDDDDDDFGLLFCHGP